MVDHADNLDIDKLLQVIDTGVRRACLFVDLGTLPIDAEITSDVKLGPLMSMQLMRSDPSPEEIAEIKAEYAAWVTGNALNEIDAALHHFLDRYWVAAQYIDVGPAIPNDFVPTSISKQTNSSKKLGKIITAVTGRKPHTEHHESIANARNALTHDAGIVPISKAFHDGKLRVSWEFPELVFAKDDGTEFVFDGQSEVQFSEVTKHRARFRVEQREFAVGQRVELTTEEVKQIGCYVHMHAHQLVTDLVSRLESAGFAGENKSDLPPNAAIKMPLG